MLAITDPAILPPPGSQVDWSHPIARDLVFCALPGLNMDLVSGNQGTLFANGFLDGTTRHGRGLRSSSAINGGISFPFADNISSIRNDFTILAWTSINSADSSGKILAIPFRGTGWTSPFISLSFGRAGTTQTGELAFAREDTSSFNNLGSDANYVLINNSFRQYAVTRLRITGTNAVSFYRDGQRFGTSKALINIPVHLLNKQPICLFQRSPASNGEGMVGTMPCAMIWARALSANEIASLYAHPYQFLYDSYDLRYFT
jgi:Concanavalin A-like lectin/glucanases superfamily